MSGEKKVFTSWSDAAFADDLGSRFSSAGFLFQLYGGPIFWKSIKQKTVTTSSTEAELLALTCTAKELIWWSRFFDSIHFDTQQSPTIYCDNLQTIRLLTTETPRLNTKLKHVDIHQAWLRQEVQKGKINIEWVPTNVMAADGFTKELPGQKHSDFVRQLGLVELRIRN